jgi:hypothetical protein
LQLTRLHFLPLLHLFSSNTHLPLVQVGLIFNTVSPQTSLGLAPQLGGPPGGDVAIGGSSGVISVPGHLQKSTFPAISGSGVLPLQQVKSVHFPRCPSLAQYASFSGMAIGLPLYPISSLGCEVITSPLSPDSPVLLTHRALDPATVKQFSLWH